MFMIKLLGGALIFISCAGFGFQIAASYLLERQLLSQWINALDFMQCELQYRMTSLPEICRQAACNGKGRIRLLFGCLADELERQLLPDVSACMDIAVKSVPDLPQSLQEAAEELGKTLGRFDTDGQILQLEAARRSSRKRLEDLEKDAQERTRAYHTLGVCGGAAIAILLI